MDERKGLPSEECTDLESIDDFKRNNGGLKRGPSSISNSTIPFQSFLGRLDAASASLITD